MTDFWQGKRVSVPGGAGFLASHLVPLLCESGAHVTVLDDYSRGRAVKVHPTASYFKCDVTDLEWLVYRFEDTDIVLNLAAHVAGVNYNQSHQVEMFNRNMALQMLPVQAAEQAGVGSYCQVSSVCCYGPGYTSPCKEESGHAGEPTAANAGYGWSKRMGERVAIWSKIPHVVIVRPSNLLGPFDWFDDRAHVIPALIKKCLHDDAITVNGSGRELREFIYAGDVARGIMLAIEHGKDREAYNLGTNGATCVTIAELVRMIQAETGTLDKPVQFVAQFDSGDEERWSYCAKSASDLGWTASTSLIEAIKHTVAWYRENE